MSRSKETTQDQIINSIVKILDSYRLDISVREDVIGSFSQDKVTAFRINTLKTDREAVIAGLAEANINYTPVTWSPITYLIDDKAQLSRSSLATEGAVYIQNLSSQLTTVVLDPQADSFILDLAAAPGGKTSYIAALMKNTGKISAVEPVKDRYYRMIANIRNLGVTNTRCYQKDGRAVGKLCTEWFDKVLLDAPCSSMAQIDLRSQESYQHWNLKKVKECSRKQKQLICSAFDSLKPGGEMVYSTCSWMVEENEAVVNHLIEEYGDLVEIADVSLPIDNYLPGLIAYQGEEYDGQLQKTIRIIPDSRFEAFYLAKIKKLG